MRLLVIGTTVLSAMLASTAVAQTPAVVGRQVAVHPGGQGPVRGQVAVKALAQLRVDLTGGPTHGGDFDSIRVDTQVAKGARL